MAEAARRVDTASAAVERNPFPGLRPFRPDEEHLFFGRESQVDRMVDKLALHHFLAVVGTSGSGKSSLVNCGLRPALHRGYMAKAGSAWRMVQFRPGDDPIGALAEALARPGTLFREAAPGGMSLAQLVEATLRLGSLGLVDIVEQARLAPGENLLLVVDQFEELFRFHGLSSQAGTPAHGPSGDSVAFVRMLLEAAAQREQPIYVVLTMRSDFLGECAQFQGLAEAVNDGQYLVPRLTRDEIRAAITGPVNVARAGISPVLLTRLLNDVGDNPDQLSILQHALNRTWARWEHEGGARGVLDLAHYESIGGMQHALDRHAEKAYAELDVQQQRICERVFKALTDKGTDPRGIRRPMRLASLCAVIGASQDDVVAVINRFRKLSRSFLMPPLGEDLTPDSVIDISHESFMRVWDRLAKWANEEAESRAMLLRLFEAVRLHAQERGGLWRDPELKQALKWREETKPTSPWAGLLTNTEGAGAWESVTNFLDSSVSALESSAQASRRVQARKRLWAGLATALAVILFGLAVRVALDASARHKSIAAELTNRAVLDVDRDPARSAHLALAALDQNPANAGAEAVLRRALANLEVAYTEATIPLGEPVRDARYSRDGTRLVIASGHTVTIYDSRTFAPVEQMHRSADIWKAWLIADNAVLITHATGSGIQMQRLGDSVPRALPCPGEGNIALAPAVSPDERYVAIGCWNGDIHVWDTARPEHELQELGYNGNPPVTALAFSADSKYLASGDVGGVVDIWTVGQPAALVGRDVEGDQTLKIRHRDAIRDIAFHPSNNTLIVTAGEDHQAYIWKLDLDTKLVALDEETKRAKSMPLEHDRPVLRAFFIERADGSSPVVTVSDKVVRLWENEDRDLTQVRGHDDWVADANVSRDGEQMVTSSNDGTARIWSTRSGTPLAVLRGHLNAVNQAVFSPDGHQVMTASEDGTVRVWRIRPPRILLSRTHWILGAAFEPGGTRIAVGEEGPAAILDTSGDGIGKRRDLAQFGKEEAMVGFMSWSRDRKLLIGNRQNYHLMRWGQSVALWDVQSRMEVTPGWLQGYRYAEFGTGTDDLLTINQNGGLAIWKCEGLTNGEQPVRETQDFGKGYLWATMSPDGTWIAAVSGDNNVLHLWKRAALPDGPRYLVGHGGGVMSLAFSSDSKRIVTASRDHTAIIWSVDSDQPVATLADSQSAELMSASFDPSGTRVATGAADGTIRVWDVTRSKVVAVLRWDDESVNEVQFSADGKSILSASDDGTVTLGQCDACSASVPELRERAAKLANWPSVQMEAVKREIEQVRGHDKLAGLMNWLSRK
jgi:WD40 repeat protein